MDFDFSGPFHLPGLGFHGAGDAFFEGGEVARQERHSGGHRVPAIAQQEMALGADGLGDVDPVHRTGGTVEGVFAGQQNGGFVVAFHQSVGDDPDHAAGPFRVMQDDRRRTTVIRRVFEEFLRGLGHLTRHHAPLGIERFNGHADHPGASGVVRGQEFHDRVGVAQPPHGIQPGRDLEADMRLGDPLGVEPGVCKKGLQAQAFRMLELAQSLLQEPAGIAFEDRHVRHDAQRGQFIVGAALKGFVKVVEQALDQLTGHADARQGPQGVILREPLGVDHGRGGRQRAAEGVMVGEHNRDAGIPDLLDIFMLGDPRVTGDQQVKAFLEIVLKDAGGDPVRLFRPDGDVIDQVSAQGAQAFHQDGGGGLAIHVEISPDQDLLPVVEGFGDQLIGYCCVGEFVG